MAQRQPAQVSPHRTLADVHPKPLRADIHPRAQSPTILLRPKPDRRNVPARELLLRRVLLEFEDMPGLSLTLPQAVRLLGLPSEICMRILTTLVATGHLQVTSRGHRLDSRDNLYRSSSPH
jgi:hypothetical protein